MPGVVPYDVYGWFKFESDADGVQRLDRQWVPLHTAARSGAGRRLEGGGSEVGGEAEEGQQCSDCWKNTSTFTRVIGLLVWDVAIVQGPVLTSPVGPVRTGLLVRYLPPLPPWASSVLTPSQLFLHLLFFHILVNT